MITGLLRATPVGVRDYTPELAEAFYSLQGELMAAFKSAGYSPIITPTFELAAVFERGIGERGRGVRPGQHVDAHGEQVVARAALV